MSSCCVSTVTRLSNVILTSEGLTSGIASASLISALSSRFAPPVDDAGCSRPSSVISTTTGPDESPSSRRRDTMICCTRPRRCCCSRWCLPWIISLCSADIISILARFRSTCCRNAFGSSNGAYPPLAKRTRSSSNFCTIAEDARMLPPIAPPQHARMPAEHKTNVGNASNVIRNGSSVVIEPLFGKSGSIAWGIPGIKPFSFS